MSEGETMINNGSLHEKNGSKNNDMEENLQSKQEDTAMGSVPPECQAGTLNGNSRMSNDASNPHTFHGNHFLSTSDRASLDGSDAWEAPSHGNQPDREIPAQDMNASKNSDLAKSSSSSNKSTKEETGSSQNSDYDAVGRELVFLLDDKLNSARKWTKRLLQEITVYVETAEECHKEYKRVQDLEHETSERLDSVEPDVHNASTTLYQNQHFLARHHSTSQQMEISSHRADIEKSISECKE